MEGCAKLTHVGAALGVTALASLRRLDMGWLGSEIEHEGPEEEADAAALRVCYSSGIVQGCVDLRLDGHGVGRLRDRA